MRSGNPSISGFPGRIDPAGTEPVPKIYTSRHKKTERVLKGCFVVLFIILAIWVLKIIILDSPKIATNAYNPRLYRIQKNFYRGTLYDRNHLVMAETIEDGEGNRVRVYPYGEALGFTTGYSGTTQSGMERAVNDWLLHTSSFKDAMMYWFFDQVVEGADVETTFDAELTAYIYDLFGDLNGAVIVSDVDTGELLVMLSKPSYDPETVLEYWDVLEEDPDHPLLNRAAKGLYPPGSTFKIITSLAWFRSPHYDPAWTYDCCGSDVFGEFELPCIGYTVHGEVPIEEAFAYSCNTFFATLGNKLGNGQLMDTMDSVGFKEPFDFSMDIETASYDLRLESDDGETAISSIGQGTITVTPLFLNRLTCAIANEGKVHDYMTARRAVTKEGKVLAEFDEGREERILSAREAEYLTGLMEGVTSYGTAYNLADLPVYGKTGTAENETDLSHSWFTGFMAPENGHKMAVTVIVECSGGRLSGSYVARQIFDWLMAQQTAEVQ